MRYAVPALNQAKPFAQLLDAYGRPDLERARLLLEESHCKKRGQGLMNVNEFRLIKL